VFELALAIRADLERQGIRVVLSRQPAENPSFDERAALANALRGAVFISLHVASTGRPRTAQAFYFRESPIAGPPNSGPALSNPPMEAQLTPEALLRWDQAFAAAARDSHTLARLLQAQLRDAFPGSPAVPEGAPVRQLRSIAAPAAAIELASVAVADRSILQNMAPALAAAIARAVLAAPLTASEAR